MTKVLPFRRRSEAPIDRPAEVSIDVDGDGRPDPITTPNDRGEESSTEALAVRAPDGSATVPASPDDRPPIITATVVTQASERPGELRPIVPGWMRTAEGRRAVARWWLHVQWHKVRYHAVRLPGLAWRVLWRAPRGAWRGLSGVTRWALDTRADGLEQMLATGTKADAEEFRKLRQDRAVRIRSRLAVVAMLCISAVVAGVLWCRFTGPHGRAILLVGVLGALARIGSDPGRPLVGPAMAASSGFRELTDAIVMRALRAAGLGGQAAKLDKAGNVTEEDTRPTLPQPIARSANGRGYEVVVDLPYGKTAGDAADQVEKLASGLDVEAGQVFPEPVPGSARRVRLYVADEDPMLLPAHRSPLARLPKVSVWDPQPIARTPVGHVVMATLLFCSFLIGAVPRAGKSFAAKVVVVPAALDPECDLTVLDCGGGRDWLPTAEVAVDYVSGDEEEDLLRIVFILNRIRDEARARLAEFRKMSAADLPEDKITRAMAAAGHRPHVVVVDELQNLLRSPNKDINKAALEVLTWLAKTAPKAGYILVMITQRPAADVIPADLRDIVTVRLALRTMTRQGSDAILGSDISATGFRTDRFLESHKGACVIGGISTGRGGDLQYARTDLLMPAEFARACQVGRMRREEAGTLRGQAAGELPEVVITVTVIEDVAAVWPGDEAKVQAHVLVGRLREVYGDRYAGMDEGGLTRALKAHGVASLQVYREGSNRNGYALADLSRARKAIESD